MSEELRDEQNFLLSSIRDLDKELAVGDIDQSDYETLRDGYIARTASITRELGGADVVTTAPTKWFRRMIASVVVLALGLGGGVWVAQNSGQRLPGQSSSGGIEESTATLLSSARQLNFSDPSQAIELYSEVLKIEPDNPEALTYRSWILALTARNASGSVKQLALSTAVTDLLRVQTVDPSYPDAHCFLGIIYFRFLDNADLAQKQLAVCQEQNPPAEVKSFVDAIIKEVNAAAAR